MIRKIFSRSVISCSFTTIASTFFTNSLAILSLLIATHCASDEIKVADNQVEPALTEVTGVETKRSQEAAARRSLSLDDLYALAVERTQRLAIKQEGVVQAEARKSQALGSWIPSLLFRDTRTAIYPNNAKKEKEDLQKKQLLATTLLGQTPSSSYIAGLTSSTSPESTRRLVLHIPIFTGLNEYAGLKASTQEIAVRKQELRHDAGRFLLELAQDYYNIIELEISLKTQGEILKLTEQSVGELQRLVALGRTRRTDLLNALASREKSIANIRATEDTLKRTREGLAAKSAADPEFIASDTGTYPDLEYSAQDIDRVCDNRADVSAAKSNLELSKARLTGAWGGHLPSVFVEGSYGLPQRHHTYTRDLNAQLTIQVPIFSGGVVSAQIKEAESQKRQAELTLSETKRQALAEVRQAYGAWVASSEQIPAYKKALDAAELNYSAQEAYFNRRQATVIELLTALSSLASAREDYNRSLLQKRLNRIWVGVATGELPVSTRKVSGEQQ